MSTETDGNEKNAKPGGERTLKWGAFAAEQGIGAYRTRIDDLHGLTVYISDVPLTLWLEISARSAETGGYSAEDVALYLNAALGEGMYERLCEAGLTQRERDLLFDTCFLVNNGAALGNLASDGEEEGEAEAR